jgi:hypothetical protein
LDVILVAEVPRVPEQQLEEVLAPP